MNFKQTIGSLCCLLISCYTYAFENINPTNVQIVRDSFGTPYIYAKTDAEVAYGLAWANAEDAFPVVQEIILSGIGRYGEVASIEGAKRDFLVKSLQLKERIDTLYESSFSAEYKKYVNGYVQGINHYAKMHPNECLLKDVFPISDKAYLQGTMFICCYMQFVHKDLQRILDGTFDEPSSNIGSNFYAMNSHKTADQNIFLCANPHQPLEGPFSWYEAHLKSDEGLDVHGCLFFGGSSIAIGTTPNLSWSMTFNALDLSDVYALETKEVKNILYYKYNNEWLVLNPVNIILKVKALGTLLKVKKTTYTSIHGPVYKSKHGKFFAVRCGALFNIKANEQLLQMNKATHFTDWFKALELQGLPRYNIAYADRYDTIFYIDNGQIPDRIKGLDYTKPIDGNDPKLLWTHFIKETSLPQVLNPNCGYIFNTNNSEFTCTCPESMQDSADHSKFPQEAAYRTTENNRSERFMELIQTQAKFSFQDFKKIKYDISFPKQSAFLKSLSSLYSIDKNKYPDISKEIDEIQKWDRTLDTNSVGAALNICVFHFLFEDKHYGSDAFLTGINCDEAGWIKYIHETKKYLLKYFKNTDISYGTLCRQMRGPYSTPTLGFPDMLEASYAKPIKDGHFKVYIGDSYIQFTNFNHAQLQSCESMLPFGISSNQNSPHYADQMKLYLNKTCKPVYFNKSDLLLHAEKTYFLQ